MPLEASLLAAEEQLKDVRAALLATDPATLEQAAGQLRSAATALARALDESSPGAGRSESQARRIQDLGRQLTMLRDQLARLLALTDRQAASLLPPSLEAATYEGTLGARRYRAPG